MCGRITQRLTSNTIFSLVQFTNSRISARTAVNVCMLFRLYALLFCRWFGLNFEYIRLPISSLQQQQLQNSVVEAQIQTVKMHIDRARCYWVFNAARLAMAVCDSSLFFQMFRFVLYFVLLLVSFGGMTVTGEGTYASGNSIFILR